MNDTQIIAADFVEGAITGTVIHAGVSHVAWRITRGPELLGTLNWRALGGPQMVTKPWTAWTPEGGRRSSKTREPVMAAFNGGQHG